MKKFSFYPCEKDEQEAHQLVSETQMTCASSLPWCGETATALRTVHPYTQQQVGKLLQCSKPGVENVFAALISRKLHCR